MTKTDTPMSHCPKGGSPITSSFSSPQNRDLLKDYGALSVKSPSVTCTLCCDLRPGSLLRRLLAKVSGRLLGWTKSAFGFFHKMLRKKNLKKHSGQPKTRRGLTGTTAVELPISQIKAFRRDLPRSRFCRPRSGGAAPGPTRDSPPRGMGGDCTGRPLPGHTSLAGLRLRVSFSRPGRTTHQSQAA